MHSFDGVRQAPYGSTDWTAMNGYQGEIRDILVIIPTPQRAYRGANQETDYWDVAPFIVKLLNVVLTILIK
ncbi:hypothetical protein DDR33_10190 [Pararcticibacter amylolyticus]|uniref:Uncharacterized protein n=1 Tax=Pararcticibacter amylolyticus TaxID=2173175 RepID=A0A2U2PHC2_9SPHI|nr:hypothetical protein DDR33_10190 [Pararcticibacter amylolyticus]